MKFLSSYQLFCGLVVFVIITHVLQVYHPETLMQYVDSVFIRLHFMKSAVMQHIHFSVGEVLYVLCGIILIYLLVMVLRIVYLFIRNRHLYKRKLQRKTCLFLNVVGIMYIMFFYNWVVLYSYQKILDADLVQARQEILSIEKNNELVDFLHKKMSSMNPEFTEDNASLNAIIRDEYQKVFSEKIPHLYTKESLFRSFLNTLGISGYYHPFTGESFINSELNLSLQPFVVAHEMAHQLGVVSESEANYMAFWLCENSQNPQLQYSAYMNVMMQCLYAIRREDSLVFNNTIDTFSEQIKSDVKAIYEYRMKSRSSLSTYSLGIYNWFLKSNNKGIGLRAYGQLRGEVYNYEFLDDRRLPVSELFHLNKN